MTKLLLYPGLSHVIIPPANKAWEYIGITLSVRLSTLKVQLLLRIAPSNGNFQITWPLHDPGGGGYPSLISYSSRMP